MEIITNIPSAEECATRIFDYCGRRLEPETACDVWLSILHHKWFLSEKLGRDVGVKVACLDYFENVDPGTDSGEAEQVQVLRELGASMVDTSVWETIADNQPPKQIVNRRIILPLTETELARKHGVITPKTIIFFGPPGTGKTHFVKAIAGVLGWWYVEISPSDLMAEGADRVGYHLKRLMEKVSSLDKVVLFIDEFEEIAGSREQASRLDKSITNEMLKQVPVLKRSNRKMLLVCATNFIRELDAALLRPGRFDCIIPVGALDDLSRRRIFEYYLENTNHGKVDVDSIIASIPFFTPADIEYLFQKTTQVAFERELELGKDYKLNTDIFLENIKKMKPTLNAEIIEEFKQDSVAYTRY